MRPYLQGEDALMLYAPEFDIGRQAIAYSWRPKHEYAIFTTCSWAKPFSQSYVHTPIRLALYDAGLLNSLDYVHISTAGVIPHECETWYPFCAYDWNNDRFADGDSTI